MAPGVHFVVKPFMDGRIPRAFRTGVAVGSQPWGVKDTDARPVTVEVVLTADARVLQNFAAESPRAAYEMIERLESELAAADSLADFLGRHGVPTHLIRRAIKASEGG